MKAQTSTTDAHQNRHKGAVDPQEVLRKLREIQHWEIGSQQWPPALGGVQTPNWGTLLSKLCGDAADLIERLMP